jgi:hypothetical protein
VWTCPIFASIRCSQRGKYVSDSVCGTANSIVGTGAPT